MSDLLTRAKQFQKMMEAEARSARNLAQIVGGNDHSRPEYIAKKNAEAFKLSKAADHALRVVIALEEP